MSLTLRERVEKLERLPAGGIITDESRYDFEYMVSLLNAARQVALSFQWKLTKRIPYICYQKHYPRYESDMQQDIQCFVRFCVPDAINLWGQGVGENTDGFVYVGDVSGKRGYAKITDRGQLSTLNQHRFMKNNGRYMAFMFDAPVGAMEIYGNPDLRKLLINGLFSDPRDCNTYNVDFDPYPIDDQLGDMCEKAIFGANTSIIASTTPDYISNSTDINTMSAQIAAQFRKKK
jgi:hypothetical protein